MNATPLYFRKLFSGARKVNFGNTVLVQRDNGEWWLGYVQNVYANRFFVDFDASTINAQWIHTKHLWPHRFISSRSNHKHLFGGEPIQVALRNSPGEPLIFRSGKVTDWENDMFFFVNVDNHNPDRKNPQSTASHIVHRNYFVKTLPVPGDGESFYGRTTGFLYKKHVLKFPEAHLLPEVKFLPAFLGQVSQFAINQSRDPCDNCGFGRIVLTDITTFVCEGTHWEYYCMSYPIELGCRVFVQVVFDTITFICAEMHSDADGRSMYWNEEFLRKACKDYLIEKQRRGSANADTTPRNTSHHDVEEMSINDLPHPIVLSILLHLDVDSLLQASRVSELWRLLTRKIRDTGPIVFDMCRTCAMRPHDDEAYAAYTRYITYQMVTTLDGILSGRTRTLVLTADGNHAHAADDVHAQIRMIKSILQNKGLRLPVMIVKNGLNCDQASFLTFKHNTSSDSFECVALTELMSVCEELLLVNYNAADAITLSAQEVLFLDRAAPPYIYETAFLRYDIYDARCDVFIPLLRFRCPETTAEQRRIFLATANNNCPPVSLRVLEKAKAIHARWVRTLAYPDQWVQQLVPE
ncbi:uncharacterized protein LOC129592955 [Paramacrobiotus metropolitanus]|uniref:uncharacterized protein LOC129592955 n=1 Tax=Paramacrobiotus metropolitanus TaxID=2943436 RepID=UPI002445EF89|nr:uncharacterized protein LOC129592955 [Paramacrobiotus metropolitanus]